MNTKPLDSNRHIKNAIRALFLEIAREPLRSIKFSSEGETGVRVMARGAVRKMTHGKSTATMSWAGSNEREAMIGLLEYQVRMAGDPIIMGNPGPGKV